jgi:hypothetical protein
MPADQEISWAVSGSPVKLTISGVADNEARWENRGLNSTLPMYPELPLEHLELVAAASVASTGANGSG